MSFRKAYLRIVACALALASPIVAQPVQAMGLYYGGMYGGGMYGGGMYGGAAFTPFMGMPMFPGGYSGYQTGQMMGYDPRMQMAMALNWNGAQKMGYSYLPPIGLSAIQNSLSAGAYGL